MRQSINHLPHALKQREWTRMISEQVDSIGRSERESAGYCETMNPRESLRNSAVNKDFLLLDLVLKKVVRKMDTRHS